MGRTVDAGVLQPGEVLIASSAVQFPCGSYKRVRGFRSFRDFQGRDISSELPGWPPSARPGEPPARGSAKGRLLTGIWCAESCLQLVVELAFGGSSAFSAPEYPEDREDHQVLAADPGTIALGAPWQLDPARNKAKPRVVLHVTDRRLLFSDPASGAMLWEITREDVATTTEHAGVRITFADDSWIRLSAVKDKQATVPDRDEDFRTVTVKGKPTRVPTTQDTTLRFRRRLLAFAPPPSSDSL